MPFELPDLAWSTWFIAALCGAILAILVPKLAPRGSRAAGVIVFVIICLAAVCAVIGIIKWTSQ
jgi:predicted branched-subunit amino acid permease